MLIRDLNPDERPIERLIRNGPETLSDAELLSIIFGGQTSLRAARTLLSEGLIRFPNTPKLKGLPPVRFARVKALLELSKRLCDIQLGPLDSPVSAESLGPKLAARYRDHIQEHLGAIYLDGRLRIISEREIFIGSLQSAVVSPIEILRFALLENAAAFIVHHNHPSGDPSPSAEDIAFTARLNRAATDVGLELADHLVLGRSRYVSMLQRGYITRKDPNAEP